MRKLVLAIMVFAGMIMSTQVSAKVGDIAGYIYSTDIKAIINGVEVPSYNIGGRTVVVIEDVIDIGYGNYSYNDSLRKLTVTSFNPRVLVEGSSKYSGKPGNVIGNIYETDIKTVMYDVEIPSYNLNGKTAVAIEDLGEDKEFSEIGGRYVWNEKERVISLEFMYECLHSTKDADITINFNDELTEGEISFVRNPFDRSGNIIFNWPEWFSEKPVNAIIPLYNDNNGNKVLIGYHFYRLVEKNEWKPSGFTAFTYLYEDEFNKAIEQAEVLKLSREDIINYYTFNKIGYVLDRYDAESYSFLYMSAGLPHGPTQYLLLANDDGTFHDYSKDFESVSMWGNKLFDNVTIDKEAEKVYFRYDTDYVIDLTTGEMAKAE